jgi:hypothetical protein
VEHCTIEDFCGAHRIPDRIDPASPDLDHFQMPARAADERVA